MFTFIKKLFGFDQETMKAAGVQTEQAPYKVEQPIPAYDIVPQPIIAEGAGIVEPVLTTVHPEVPYVAVQAAPTKKTRQPRAPKAEKTAVKKAAPIKKAAAMKAAPKKPRSKKA